MAFKPAFTITAKVANALMRIEAAKQAVHYLPITPAVLASLRETARLYTTHYSTMIEGNRLTQEQVSKVIEKKGHLRQGIATALLTALEQRLPLTARLAVTTAEANIPAVALYRRFGYTPTNVIDSPEGIPLVHLVKFIERGV